MSHSNKSVSPLRQRMIEDMTLRKLGPSTQTGYIRAVVKLTRYLGRSPDTATAQDLRLFQLYMVQQGDSSITINATLTGLKFFFENTLDQPELLKKVQRVYEPRKIPEILSVEEVTRVLKSGRESEVQGSFECCLRCRATCQRDRASEDLGYRR